jgi:hypothetical protein
MANVTYFSSIYWYIVKINRGSFDNIKRGITTTWRPWKGAKTVNTSCYQCIMFVYLFTTSSRGTWSSRVHLMICSTALHAAVRFGRGVISVAAFSCWTQSLSTNMCNSVSSDNPFVDGKYWRGNCTWVLACNYLVSFSQLTCSSGGKSSSHCNPLFHISCIRIFAIITTTGLRNPMGSYFFDEVRNTSRFVGWLD